MTVGLSSRLVSSSLLDNKFCPVTTTFKTTWAVPITLKTTFNVPITFKECNVVTYGSTKQVALFIPQGADQVFQFTDTDETTDYSSVSAVTFDVWESISSGSVNRITKSVGSGITIVDDYKISVTVNNTDSNITAQKYYFELWVTVSGGSRYLLKYGDFNIMDTRKFDV